MKALIFSAIILFSCTFALTQTPEHLTLRMGQEKVSRTGRLTVKFLELIEDSRCPEDVNCVWAGVARIKIRVSKNGKTSDFELNTNQGDKPAVFQGHSIALKELIPRQSKTSKYSPSAYTATLAVSRLKS